MTRYKRDSHGVFRDPNGNRLELPDGDIACPMVMNDIAPYTSPIDGKLISSRSARREDLKRSGCEEFEPSMSPTRGKLNLKNKRFAEKHGLPLGEDYR